MGVIAAVRRIAESVLDAVMPLRGRAARTKQLRAEALPLSPTVHALLGTHITTLMDYKQPAVQDLVRSLKYDASPHAARLAADVLVDFLREELASAHAFSTKEVLLVPIPLHTSRARERGFNQIEVVLRALPREFIAGPSARLAPEALSRVRRTRPQTKLSRRERLSNVAGAFATTSDLHRAQVFLIDDVTTTGATLTHAAAALKRAGTEVTLLALARA